MEKLRSFNVVILSDRCDSEFTVQADRIDVDDKSIAFFVGLNIVCYLPIKCVYYVKEFFIDTLSFETLYHC